MREAAFHEVNSQKGSTHGKQLLTLHLHRKYPQFQQQDIFALQDAFRKLDVDDKGYIDEATVIKATQNSERQPYDVVRSALKEVELDSSRRVELDDYVDVCQKMPDLELRQMKEMVAAERWKANLVTRSSSQKSVVDQHQRQPQWLVAVFEVSAMR